MAILPGTRVRTNGVVGITTDNPLSAGATSFSSTGLPKLGVVVGNHAIVTLDPMRQFGEPEIVLVTVHTAASTIATIQRGMYGTIPRIHPAGTLWVHAAVSNDFIEIVTSTTRPSDPYEGQIIYEMDNKIYKSFNGTEWANFSSGGGVTDHGTLTGLGDNDHPQYQLVAEKGAANGYASLDAGSKVPLAQIPTAVATDTEVTAAVSTHEAASDPHPGYATDADLTNHVAAADPHPGYTTAAELATGIATHEGASDPHTGYQKESEKGVANGYASLDAGGVIPIAQISTVFATDNEVITAVTNHEAATDPHAGYQKESEKGIANGYAGLDASALVPTAQMATGTPTGTKFLRDDRTWQTVSGGGGSGETDPIVWMGGF